MLDWHLIVDFWAFRFQKPECGNQSGALAVSLIFPFMVLVG